jgi:serine/threonine protein kinase
MAETFEALRRGPGGFEQRVCIKRILPAFEEDAQFVEAFLREARTSAALRHANIVQVLDFGVADGSHYLALELIDGADLRDVLSTAPGEAFTPELTTLVALDVAAALAYAHEGAANRASVVHRDLSPSNVLVSRAGELKLGDFGIAKTAGAQPMTATGIIKGKVPYLPPEYIETGHFDARGDLYALGVMLYEVLTGQRPFDGDHDLETIRRIAVGNRPPLRALRPDVPPTLEQVIERLLALDPNERIQSANEVLHALPMISVPVARQRLSALVAAFLATKPAPPTQPASDHAMERTLLAPPPGARPFTLNTPRSSGFPAHEPTPAFGASHPAAFGTPNRSPSGRVWPPQIDDDDELRTQRRRTPTALIAVVALASVAAGAFTIAFFAKEPWKSDAPPSAKAAELPPQAQAAKQSAPTPADPSGSTTQPSADAPFIAPYIPASGDEKAAATTTTQPAPKKPSHASQSASQRAASTQSAARSATSEKKAAELKVVAIPFGDVWIDGKRVGPSPFTIKLAPGTYQVGAGDGRQQSSRDVTLGPGERQSAVFEVGSP